MWWLFDIDRTDKGIKAVTVEKHCIIGRKIKMENSGWKFGYIQLKLQTKRVHNPK